MPDTLQLIDQPAAKPVALRRGKHVAALFDAVGAVMPQAVRAYRKAAHVSLPQARRRALAVARIVTGLETANGREVTRMKNPEKIEVPRGMARGADGVVCRKF